MHVSLDRSLWVLVPFISLASAAPSGSGALVKLSFGLEPADPSLLGRTLHEISDPLSPRYGQHLAREEAHALVAPRDDSADVVKRWLTDAGIPRDQISHEGRWVHANVPNEHARRIMLSDSVFDVKRALPDSVNNHIALVHRSSSSRHAGHLRRDLVHERSRAQVRTAEKSDLESRKSDLKNCHKVASPACMRNWYKIPTKKEKPTKGNLLGIVGFFEV
jgi:tripeptidyl-peptidase-1